MEEVRWSAAASRTPGNAARTVSEPHGHKADVGRARAVPSAKLSRTRWVALLLTTYPVVFGIQLALPVGGGSLYLTDVLLPVCAGVSLLSIRGTRQVSLVAAPLAGALVIGISTGLAHGAPFQWLIRDARTWVYMLCGFLIAVDLLQSPSSRRFAIKSTTWYLWIGAALTVLATAFPSADILAGVNSDVVFRGVATGVELSADRSQTSLNALGICLVCGLIGFSLNSRRISRGQKLLFIPLVTIVFLSYARNALVAVVFAVFLGVIVRARGVSFGHKLARVAVAAVVGTLCLVAFYASGLLEMVLGSQINSYVARVIGGLTGSALETDSSIQWRSTENHFALLYIPDHLVTGGGFGVPYRPYIVGEPFTDTSGTIYIHEAYLGLLIKLGLIGTMLFAFAVVFCLLRALRALRFEETSPIASAVVCALGAVLLTNTVSPTILTYFFTAIFGAVLGIAFLLGMPSASLTEEPASRSVC